MRSKDKFQKLVIMGVIALVLWQVTNPTWEGILEDVRCAAFLFLFYFFIDWAVTEVWK